MISDLPDDILHHILSHLTLKEACITSALSKRWRHLFPSLPRLDFDYYSFRYSRPHDKFGTPMDCWLESVRDVLESRRSAVRICTIRSFAFCQYHKDFNSIIHFLCNLGIQELTLNNRGQQLYTVRPCLYVCRTLTRIELSKCILKVRRSKFSVLRRLNTVKIEECIVEDGDMQRLILGCQALERLTLNLCHGLRNLTVDAPKLAVLDVTTDRPLAVSIVNAPLLESVTLRFIYDKDNDTYDVSGTDGEGECSRLVRLLESLGSIQNLSIQKNTYLKGLTMHGLAVPVTLQSLLPKMKKLTLLMRPNDTLMLSVVSCLLNSCPNLKDLVIGDSDVYEWDDYMYQEASMLDYWDQQIPSDCIRNSLSAATVVLRDSNYWEYWIKLAKFLLNNACVLKNLVIDCYHQYKFRLGDLPRELLLLRRASPDVVVELKAHRRKMTGAYASSLDVIGCFGSSVMDTAILLSAISGHDRLDATSSKNVVPNYSDDLISLNCMESKPMEGLRVGMIQETLGEGVDSGVAHLIQSAASHFDQLGARVTEVSLPSFSLGLPAYYILAASEASSNLSRYDGVRYGNQVAADELNSLYGDSRSNGFGAEVKMRILMGTYALSAGYYDAYYKRAQQVRTLVQKSFKDALDEHDILISPAAPSAAYKIGEKTNDPLAMYAGDIMTVNVNLAGLPALVVPCGFVEGGSAGLPVGLQMIGSVFSEGKLLRVGHIFEQTLQNYRFIPPLLAEGKTS